MIPAEKRPWFSRWLARHAERRLRRTFAEVHVAGLEVVRDLARTRPVLVVANHTAWWDPMLVLMLSERVLGLDGYALMDATNLRRFRFFALVGAFGVDLGDPRDGARAIRHAARLLDRPGRAVWMFPQGGERPLHEPLVFRPGAAHIARLAPHAVVVPLGLTYAFGATERPRAWAAFGPPLEPASHPSDAVRAQCDAVTQQLQRIQACLSGCGEKAFASVVTTRRSRLSAWSSTALDRLVGRLVLQQASAPQPEHALPPPHPPGAERAHERNEQEEIGQGRVGAGQA